MKLMVICCISAMISGFPAYSAPRTTDPGHATRPRVQYGVASWYGDQEQGRPMACGEPFNEYAMVAAHRTLPLGTAVKVTNVRNGRSVVVRIMDRGPHVAGRAIDLSKGAADRLRFTRQGLAPVRISVLTTPERQRREAGLTRHAARQHRETAPSAGLTGQ
jgi:rare lipoprotein A